MSLDIYIISPEPVKRKSTGIWARVDGQTRELTREEAIERFPDVDPESIKEIKIETNEFWHRNITGNLTEMAKECCIGEPGTLYDLLWRDEEPDDILEYINWLIWALTELKSQPEVYKQFNPSNGWGTYEQLVEFVRSFIHALIDMPEGSEIKYSK